MGLTRALKLDTCLFPTHWSSIQALLLYKKKKKQLPFTCLCSSEKKSSLTNNNRLLKKKREIAGSILPKLFCAPPLGRQKVASSGWGDAAKPHSTRSGPLTLGICRWENDCQAGGSASVQQGSPLHLLAGGRTCFHPALRWQLFEWQQRRVVAQFYCW